MSAEDFTNPRLNPEILSNDNSARKNIILEQRSDTFYKFLSWLRIHPWIHRWEKKGNFLVKTQTHTNSGLYSQFRKKRNYSVEMKNNLNLLKWNPEITFYCIITFQKNPWKFCAKIKEGYFENFKLLQNFISQSNLITACIEV